MSIFEAAMTRCHSAYNAYAMDLVRSLGLLMGLSPTAIYRASVLLQRVIGVAREYEAKRRCSSSDHNTTTAKLAANLNPRGPAIASSAHPEILLVRSMVKYEDVFHRLEGVLSSDDTLIYYASAAILVTCKLECPHARIRHVVNAMERLNYRRKIKQQQQQQSLPASMIASVMTQPTALKPEVYEVLKQQVIEAEKELLIMLGFQTVVEYPHKFVLTMLSFILQRDGSASTEQAFVEWSVRACSWVNDAPRFGDVDAYGAPVLACAAIAATQPVEALEGLPPEWYVAFGILRSELAMCMERHKLDQTAVGTTTAAKAIDVELALFQGSRRILEQQRQEVLALQAIIAQPSVPLPMVNAATTMGTIDQPEAHQQHATTSSTVGGNAVVLQSSEAIRRSPQLGALGNISPPPPPLVVLGGTSAPPPPPPPSVPLSAAIVGDLEDISAKRKKEKKEKKDKSDKKDSEDEISEAPPKVNSKDNESARHEQHHRGKRSRSEDSDDHRHRSRSDSYYKDRIYDDSDRHRRDHRGDRKSIHERDSSRDRERRDRGDRDKEGYRGDRDEHRNERDRKHSDRDRDWDRDNERDRYERDRDARGSERGKDRDDRRSGSDKNRDRSHHERRR